ncbi:hypothetical protein [Streptomyces thermospinosisporus]|uniref:hypothetical protein n=1 Tax=Streptomyces thermospinosisporus TaxID=161482 RepID=UPI0031DAA4E9
MALLTTALLLAPAAALGSGQSAHAAAGTTRFSGGPKAASGVSKTLKAAPGTPGGYAFADDAQRVEGAASTGAAPTLTAGRSYRSTLPASGPVHYGVQLDGTSNAYVSVTAVPPAGGTAAVSDGLKVSLRDGAGRSCDLDTATIGAGRSPRPVTAWAVREISPRRSLCREAGTYYVSVERADPDGRGASPEPWELELAVVSEPPVKEEGSAGAPGAWNSATPDPLTGEEQRRPGGAGFAEAALIGEGVWRDDIRPGRTVFYRVPVDWGQQLHVTAELGGSGSGRSGFVPSALDLDLYNPVRGHVADLGIGYDGSQKTESLTPLPPVAHANRQAPNSKVSAVRFAGSYYLVAHLSAEVAEEFGDEPVPLVLRVRVGGSAQDGPGYQGDSVPAGIFTVTEEDREAAAEGTADGDGTAMRALAVGGIGTGSALLLGLGVWTVVARRRAAP